MFTSLRLLITKTQGSLKSIRIEHFPKIIKQNLVFFLLFIWVNLDIALILYHDGIFLQIHTEFASSST